MSYALVLKKVNFSNNKVATVTFTETTPCSGITISESTATLSSIGATKTLTCNVTPSDTTDSVIWSSSNTSVATVLDGVVTCVGIGTTTITATCGTKTATCSVTCSVEYAIGNLVRMNNACVTDTINNDGSNIDSDSQNRSIYIGCDTDHTNRTYRLFSVSTIDGYSAESFYGIPLPSGINKINISGFNNLRCYVKVYDSKRVSPILNNSSRLTQKLTDTTYLSSKSYDLDSSKGGDVFIVLFQTSGGASSNVDLSNLKITFE